MVELSRADLINGFKEAIRYKKNCIVVMDNLKNDTASLEMIYLAAMSAGVPHVEESIHMRELRTNESTITPFISMCKVDKVAGGNVEERYILLNKAKAKQKAGISEVTCRRLYHEMVAEWFVNKDVAYGSIKKGRPEDESEYFERIAYEMESRYVEMINAYGNEIGTLLITLNPRGLCENGGEEWRKASIDCLCDRLGAFQIG